ncbi:hypothetical protein M569_07652, partial [Genlisea aurea]
VLVRARDIGKLHEELETAIDERRVEDAWNLHEKHKQVEGFARKSTVCKLIARLTESSDVKWLEKAYGLVSKAFEDHKQTLFDANILMYLSLGLAKCGLPIPASTLLRKLIQMEHYPPATVWSVIVAYMSRNSSGSYLAAELALEIGYLFQDGRIDPRKKCNRPLISMKPNPVAFNIVLAGCLLFGITRKAELLLDMIPRINMKPDATTLIVMAYIYERNGRIEELRKLRRHIEEVPNLSDNQLRQFYSCLLSCHLKHGDLDSASHMVLEMLRNAKRAQNSIGVANLIFETDDMLQQPNVPSMEISTGLGCGKTRNLPSGAIGYEDFLHDRKFVTLEAEAKELLDGMVFELQNQFELISTERGILKPTEKTYVRLVKAFLEAGKTKGLVDFLIKSDKEDVPVSVDISILSNVINACISLGWLDEAHDLLDEMRLAGIKSSSDSYNSLLEAYYGANRMSEIKSLESKEAKISSNAEEERASHSVEGGEIMSKLLQEVREGQKADFGINEWNNVIHFFCRRRLMSDAEKALKKMRSLGFVPNAQTFGSLVNGYAAVGGKYLEVAGLWGQMKSCGQAGMEFDVELLDSVLFTFVRGGFFTRANEVAEMMEEGEMFVDKYKYRSLYLKYHRALYKGKAPKFQKESELRRREAALAFKKWVGL